MEKFQGTVFEKIGNISTTAIMQIASFEGERDPFFKALDSWIRNEALPNRIEPQSGPAGGILYPCSNMQDFLNSLPQELITKLDLKITDEGKRITFAYTSNTNLTFEYLVVLE